MLLVVVLVLVSSLVFTLLCLSQCPPIWLDISGTTFNPGKLLLIINGRANFRYNFEVGRILLTIEHMATGLDILTAQTLPLIMLLNVSIMHIFNLGDLLFY